MPQKAHDRDVDVGGREFARGETAHRYDAFISYSHSADGLVAPALRDSLQRFATPWEPFKRKNPRRSSSIFLDNASLPANPGLWPSIEKVLSETSWFILLASSEAAASPWVDKEVQFWCRSKGQDRLLIVLSEGEIAWDNADNVFDRNRTTALPLYLYDKFTHQPKWIEARWWRAADSFNPRDPRFRDIVADLASTLRGIAKDDLIGEDLKQHRRLTLWRNAAFILIMALAVASLITAYIAMRQKTTADEMRDRALLNESRALASLADSELRAGRAHSALRIAMAGLPSLTSSQVRPWSLDSEKAVFAALGKIAPEIYRLTADQPLESARISGDRQRLITFTKHGVRKLWNVETGREIPLQVGSGGRLYLGEFTTDSKRILTVSTAGAVDVWDSGKGNHIRRLGQKRRVSNSEKELLDLLPRISLALSPDGKYAATAAFGTEIVIWNLAPIGFYRVLEGHSGFVTALAFSRDGKRLASTGADYTARVWDVQTGASVAVLRGHASTPTQVGFDPAGELLVTGATDRSARVWVIDSERKESTYGGHNGAVTSVAFSPDGDTVVTVSASEGSARLWKAATGQEVAKLNSGADATFASFHTKEPLVLVAHKDGSVRIWDIRIGDWQAAIAENDKSIAYAQFLQDDRVLLTASQDGTARLWDANIPFERARFPDQESRFVSVTFSPNGRLLAAASQGGAIRIWETSSRREIGTLRRSTGVNAVAFSPNGEFMATALADGSVEILRIETWVVTAKFSGDQGEVRSIRFAPNGRQLITAGANGTVQLWDLMANKVVVTLGDHTLHGHQAAVNSASFDPDGQRVVTASDDGTVNVWDINKREVVGTLRSHDAIVKCATFSPDGKTIATASWDGSGRLWDGSSMKAILILRGHEGPLNTDFSPDGKSILTASHDGTARIWDTASGQQIAALRGHYSIVTSAVFSPQDLIVATSSYDKTTRLWDLPRGRRLLELACARAPRYLTGEQQEQFGVSKDWCNADVVRWLRTRLLGENLMHPEAHSLQTSLPRMQK